ncbi:hypothetical protein EUGRSUZ_L02421 [Eucalyptus grandis]|uniref:Calmodulin-binding protein n=1 Tax=Eucalyptus grandis TaxID=71139 RepID=A0A058ZQV9_EUCGR|nr:hypothetical protein EUGRSUZ_L02421 [Eucalyptus grandis]
MSSNWIVEFADHYRSSLLEPKSSGKCRKEDEVRNLQLQFKTRLSLPLFTGQKLEGEHGAPIVVVLINANTGDIVQSGPESSVKLDVVVLDGDFKKEDADYWTQEEFKKYVVKEREGKRPLLTGNLEVTLKGGTGVLGELEFTDNSSWNRSKKFRLGLRVSPGYCDNVHVCEAKTEAFTVKEHRGESYKKHYPPASDDDVWRLANIAKDGSSRKRLNEAGIYKVEEFLRQLSMDSKKLRSILGKGMTDKKWKVLLDHAKNCTLNGKLYVYYHDNGSDLGVIFNNVGQLTGLTANGMFCAIDRFSLQQKVIGKFYLFHAIYKGQPLTLDYHLNFYLHCHYSIGMTVDHGAVPNNLMHLVMLHK